MFGIGMWEMMIIALPGLLLFGNRLPGVMRGLGQSVTAFRSGLRDSEDDVQKALDSQKK